MSREANVWIVLADEVLELIKDRIGDPDYDGTLVNLVRFLNRQSDYRTTSKLWKRPTIAGKERILFSVNYGEDDDLLEIQAAIDELVAELGTDFAVAGAWWWDKGYPEGRQIGTQWELDAEGNLTGEVTGKGITGILPPSDTDSESNKTENKTDDLGEKLAQEYPQEAQLLVEQLPRFLDILAASSRYDRGWIPLNRAPKPVRMLGWGNICLGPNDDDTLIRTITHGHSYSVELADRVRIQSHHPDEIALTANIVE